MADPTNTPDTSGLDGLSERLGDILDPIKAVTDALFGMYDEAEKINSAFVGGRARMDELMQATSRSAAEVIRLGGKVGDVSTTIVAIAEGSRRAVIASEEQVGKLYAASQILGVDAKDLVEQFGAVGYETSQIGVNLEKSIDYIRSVGGNTKTVTKEVVSNLDQLNRYQFEGGVQGLAKMAAQASMLRFNMQETFQFAEKVLTPEGAVETAAALQRLGVSIGNLTDPFALMNQSINDPSGLQDSLIKATKQFTQFDEETQSFKINPQGVLMLRELAKETNTSFENLSKTALAAADLDKRISQISPTLNFKKEEDRQLLANMATMEGGEYVVQIKDDEGGIIETKKLSDVTQEEFDKLREQQEKAPKNLEDLQRSQLDIQKLILKTLEGNIGKVTYGAAGSDFIRGNISGVDRIMRAVANATDATIPESRKISDKINDSVEKIAALYAEKKTGAISDTDFAEKTRLLEDEIKSAATRMGDKGIDALKKILVESNKNITGKSLLETKFRELTSDLMGTTQPVQSSNRMSKAVVEPVRTESIFGRRNTTTNDGTTVTTSKTQSDVNLGGTLTIKVETPPGISQQYFQTFFNSEEFKRMVYKYYNEKAKEVERR